MLLPSAESLPLVSQFHGLSPSRSHQAPDCLLEANWSLVAVLFSSWSLPCRARAYRTQKSLLIPAAAIRIVVFESKAPFGIFRGALGTFVCRVRPLCWPSCPPSTLAGEVLLWGSRWSATGRGRSAGFFGAGFAGMSVFLGSFAFVCTGLPVAGGCWSKLVAFQIELQQVCLFRPLTPFNSCLVLAALFGRERQGPKLEGPRNGVAPFGFAF